jgi:hypothetical protein
MNQNSKIIGEWRCKEIYIDNFRLSPMRSQKVFDHSTEFNWGYMGSGPSQLALALLLEAGADNDEASAWHQEFKVDHIASLKQMDFQMTGDVVTNWIDIKRGRKTDDTPIENT